MVTGADRGLAKARAAAAGRCATIDGMNRRSFLALAGSAVVARAAAGRSFLATGKETYILDGAGRKIWQYAGATRDGWALPGGNVLLAKSPGEADGGAAIEVDRAGNTIFEFPGTQSEVNTVQPLAGGRILLTEAGDNPRILEIDRSGRVLHEVAIACQTENHHLQTRMTRKLPNGNYLVPVMGEKQLREYTPQGEVVWSFDTPHWPFTAIRLPDGNTLTTFTLANTAAEIDPQGKVVWSVTNDDLPGEPYDDACGAQRLGNGNTVLTSYHAAAGEIKLFEVDRRKKIVWKHVDANDHGIHHFQILTADGLAPAGLILR